MKRVVVKRLKETNIGASPISTGTMIVFAKNEEAWRGRISDSVTLRNGKTFYSVENAVSRNGKKAFF